MTTSRQTIKALLLIWTLAGLGCSGSVPDPATVARIDDTLLERADLERYFAVNLLPDETDEQVDPATHLIKSRLFDAWVDEALLVRLAEGRGIEVDEQEVSDYVRQNYGTTPEGTDPWQSVEARRRLMVERLQDAANRETAPVSDAEVEEYLSQDERDVVSLRSLLLESIELAGRVHDEIRRGRSTFNEIVVRYAENPTQGVAVEIARDDLPPEVAAAVEKLRPGRVSAPVEMNGDVYLFQLVARVPASDPAGAAAVRRARRALEARRRQQAYETLIEEARAGVNVLIFPENLDFLYVPE